MNINRRSAIKQFLIISAVVSFVPSCLHEERKPTVSFNNIRIDGDQEELLVVLSETIIPTDETPGAKSLSSHLFALKMLDDCYTKEEQQNFKTGLDAFDKLAKKRFGQSFVDCTIPQRTEMISDIESKKEGSAEYTYFYHTIKKLTVQSYVTSQYYLTKVKVYELVPGRFHGCVPATSI